eukprot:Opistho-2@15335
MEDSDDGSAQPPPSHQRNRHPSTGSRDAGGHSSSSREASQQPSLATSTEDVRMNEQPQLRTPARNLVKMDFGGSLVTPEAPKAPASPGLGLKELSHIRRVEALARLDDLEEEAPALCDDVRNGKACLVCLTGGEHSRFTLVKWGWTCGICGFKTCGDCCAKVTVAQQSPQV